MINVATNSDHYSQQTSVHSIPKTRRRLDQPYVQVLNVVVETDTYILSLVRFIPDLLEFDDLIKKHYRRVKIPFPTLAETTSKADKRRSIRQFLTSLSHSKTDSEKIQRYLQKCSVEPIVRSSSIFRDFFSVQRDEDRIISKVAAVTRDPVPDIITTPSDDAVAKAKEAVVDDILLEGNNGAGKRYDIFSSLEMIKVLGKGCMGKLVIEQREITHTLAERDILTTLSGINHPFLAKLHASFQDIHRLYLVTDYYCGGDLATQMSTCTTFSKERTLFYAAEIIDGIGELHRLGILYRDLKPENILLTGDGHILLTDFGLSKWLREDDENMTQTFCGTAEYLAPEALLGEPYSFGIDYWAYGTIMYRRVLQDPLEFPPETDFETAEFLSGLLERDPRRRLGANGVDEIKAHMYFAGISWDDVYNRRLVPPYLPNLKSSLDFSNFDPSFLEMPPVLTPVSSQTDLTADMQQVFDGYSFIDERF
ncbi:kinase-like domain-containing protein, partial [Dichotomocladium elegans]